MNTIFRGISPGGYKNARLVASVDAPDYVKAMADYRCDGVADHVQINAALAEVASGGYGPGLGGTVLLSMGTFTISSYIQAPEGNFALIGAGHRHETNIFLAAGSNCDMFHSAASTASFHVLLQGLHWDGNKANQTGGDYVLKISQGYYIFRDGFVMRGYGAGMIMSGQDSHVENVFFEFNGSYGANINCVQNIQLINCTAWANGGIGINLAGQRGTVTNCRVCWNNSPANGNIMEYYAGIQFDTDANHWQVIGGYVKGNHGHGVRFKGGNHHNIVSNLYCHDNGQDYKSTTPKSSGITFESSSATANTYNIISGCHSHSTGYNVTNSLVNAQSLSGTVPITSTLVKTDLHRTGYEAAKISWVLTHSNITAFTLEIAGQTVFGESATETFTQADGWSGVTKFSYNSITYAKLTARTGTGSGDTLNCGEYTHKQKYGIVEVTDNTYDPDYNLFIGNVCDGNNNDDIVVTGANSRVAMLSNSKSDVTVTRLASVAGIDAKTVATTTLYTVPAGKTLIVDHVVIRCTAFTVGTKSIQAVASFGGNSATYDDYINSATYTVAATDTYIRDTIDDSAVTVQAAADMFKVSVETGSDATTETWAIDVFGYLI